MEYVKTDTIVQDLSGDIMNNSTENYYTDKTRISNSNIGWFLNKGPAYLHKMLTEEVEEEKNPVLERGTMIHEYILQPEEFQKDYVVWDKSRPSTVQQEKFCQELAFSTEIEPNKALLSAYKASYSVKGKTDQIISEKALALKEELNDYINYLKQNDKRKLISYWDYRMLEKIKHNIQSHKFAKFLLSPVGNSLDLNGNVQSSLYHEFHINWEWNDLKNRVFCKSLLDILIIDFKNKHVIISDLKTTQKLWHFEESMKTYDYERQLVYYSMAVNWYLTNECKIDPEDYKYNWKVDFYIIGIDTTGTYEIRVFKIEPNLYETKKDKIISKESKIIDALRDISWHQNNNLWEHTKDYYEGNGAEILNL